MENQLEILCLLIIKLVFAWPNLKPPTWEKQDWNDSDWTQVDSSCNIHSSPNQKTQTLSNQAVNNEDESDTAFQYCLVAISPCENGNQKKHEKSGRIQRLGGHEVHNQDIDKGEDNLQMIKYKFHMYII